MPSGISIAVCFTIFDVEMLTTAGTTRFTTAEYPRPAAASDRTRRPDRGRWITEGQFAQFRRP